MDNAVVEPAPLVPAPPTLAARWRALPARTQLAALLGLAALAAVLVALIAGAREGDYRVLFAGLSQKDGGLIIERLAQMNVPYRFAEGGGGALMVPAARVHELRMKLAAAGLPSGGAGSAGGGSGYEVLDKSPFGQTQGQERMSMQRAIEGELVRSIQSLSPVQSARVHLALPQMNGFFREQQKPAASVVLNLQPGRALERSQIAGIVHLVSSSVPELAPKAVSVIDSNGTLLAGAGRGEGEGEGLDSQQLAYRSEVEASLLKRVVALLEPVVGRDNVRASVSADIDFSQVLRTAEAYSPNQGGEAKPTVREQRTEESSQPGGTTAAGVPGAQSNQPPVPATAPVNGAGQTLQAAGGGSTGGTSRREQATRFEVDKTVTVTKNAVGSIKRLSAAVVVNHRTSTDAKGKTTSTPLADKELEQLTALVQQGIGYDAERGDQVKVVNVPFRSEPVNAPEALPLWQQPWLTDLLRSAAAPAALALVALVIVFTLVRPAVVALLAPAPVAAAPAAPGAQLSEVVGDAAPAAAGNPTLPALEGPRASAKLEAARKLARDNPAAVAHIVRGWVSGEQA